MCLFLQCCLPHYLSDHTCASGFDHAQCGTVQTWDDGIRTTMQQFQHTSYNLFTCNCHSFVASCLNKLAYKGSIKWNIISIVLLVLIKGQWVSKAAIIRSFAPFLLVIFLGYYMVGWPFFTGWAVFNFLLIGWFLLGTYLLPKLLFQCWDWLMCLPFLFYENVRGFYDELVPTSKIFSYAHMTRSIYKFLSKKCTRGIYGGVILQGILLRLYLVQASKCPKL